MIHILVVDDSEDVREFLTLVLEGAGYRVSRAASAQEGFQLADQLRPDLVITDVVMPGPSGLELISWIRSDLAPPVPIVIASSGFPNTEQEALQRGAALFVPKPTDPSDLLGLVAHVLQARRPDFAAITRARAHTAEARRRASDAAEELVARLLRDNPDAAARGASGARWIASYLGFGCALIAVEQGRAQRVIATSDEAGYPVGQPVDEVLPQCLDILETGSPLLLPDVAAQPSFATLSRTGEEVRFFAGVPLIAPRGLRVGVLCLVNWEPREFGLHDLAVLDFFARQIAERFFGERPAAADQRIFSAPSLLSRASFVQLLGIELNAARADGGAVELAALGLEDRRPGGLDLDVAREVPDARRSAVGELSSGQYAVYKRAACQEAASRHIEGVIRALRPISAAGVISVAADGPVVDGEDALRFAVEALDMARRAGDGEVVRFVTRRRPWAQPEPEGLR